MGGAVTAAEISGPAWGFADRAGNVLVADTSNNRVRVVAARTGRFYGQAMTAGQIYTIAGAIAGPGGLWLGDGRRATNALLNEPSGVVVESNGDVLIAGPQDYRIRQVSG